MNMKIKQKITDNLSSPERINALEKRCSIVLPEDYRTFLVNTNGGKPVERKFAFIENGRQTHSGVNCFFADCENQMNGLDSILKIYAGRIPDSFFPIATDSFGNLILMSCRNNDRNTIYFWDHEKENDPPSLANMIPVANSFSEFIEQLV